MEFGYGFGVCIFEISFLERSLYEAVADLSAISFLDQQGESPNGVSKFLESRGPWFSASS